MTLKEGWVEVRVKGEDGSTEKREIRGKKGVDRGEEGLEGEEGKGIAPKLPPAAYPTCSKLPPAACPTCSPNGDWKTN